MKTVKRIAGLAAAAAMLLSAAALPADAYVYTSYTEVENGAVAVHRDGEVYGFIAVTDGTELEEIPYWGWMSQPFKSIVEVTENIEDLVSLDNAAHDADFLGQASIIKWSESASALLASYGSDARFYKIALHDKREYLDRRSEISRNYMLENEGVLDVIAYSYHVDGLAEWWDGSIDVIYSSITTADSPERLNTYALLLEAREKYTAWQQMISDWEAETDTTGMSGAEIAASRAAAGIPSDYEMVDYAYGIAKQIKEINPEYIVMSEPDLRLYSGTMIYTAASTWDGVGDVDGNGEIDAGDAAAIMAEAALYGSGKSGTFTPEQAAAADVNADGVVDTADAAYLLVYSSMLGANAGLSLADVVKS